jgi:hypothetical protein
MPAFGRSRKKARAVEREQAEAHAARAVVRQHAAAGAHAHSGACAPPPPQPAAPAELVRVLEVVTTMCDHVVEYIESDRVERRMMIDALTRLVRLLGDPLPAATPAAHAERLIGGSFMVGPEPDRAVDIDLTAPDISETDTPVEVKCRFGGRWVDGFEISEAVADGDAVRYRLRRRIDGVVLPELFDAGDVRHIETINELMSTPPHQKHWSQL